DDRQRLGQVRDLDFDVAAGDAELRLNRERRAAADALAELAGFFEGLVERILEPVAPVDRLDGPGDVDEEGLGHGGGRGGRFTATLVHIRRAGQDNEPCQDWPRGKIANAGRLWASAKTGVSNRPCAGSSKMEVDHRPNQGNDMATSPMSEVIQHLRSAVLLRDRAGLTDGQLLEGF